jgi:hypothetical protein
MTDTTLIRRALEAAGYNVERGWCGEKGAWFVTGRHVAPAGVATVPVVHSASHDEAWGIVCEMLSFPLIAAAFVELDMPCLYRFTDITHQAEWGEAGELMYTEHLPSKLEAMAAAIVAAKEGT